MICSKTCLFLWPELNQAGTESERDTKRKKTASEIKAKCKNETNNYWFDSGLKLQAPELKSSV